MAQGKTLLKAEPGKQELVIVREFDAPRELVFRAYTEPELYTQWLGPRGTTTRIEKFELKPGGSYRYVQVDDQGNEYGFHGVYHEVRRPDVIIDTFEFEGLPEPGHVALEKIEFEELPGNRTKTVDHVVLLSVEDRDGMMSDDMEKGMNESFERLDEMLEKLQQAAA